MRADLRALSQQGRAPKNRVKENPSSVPVSPLESSTRGRRALGRSVPSSGRGTGAAGSNAVPASGGREDPPWGTRSDPPVPPLARYPQQRARRPGQASSRQEPPVAKARLAPERGEGESLRPPGGGGVFPKAWHPDTAASPPADTGNEGPGATAIERLCLCPPTRASPGQWGGGGGGPDRSPGGRASRGASLHLQTPPQSPYRL